MRASGSANDVVIDNLQYTVLPEPASLALAGIGGLCLIRRRTSR